jgi:hypothetical protein
MFRYEPPEDLKSIAVRCGRVTWVFPGRPRRVIPEDEVSRGRLAASVGA